MSKFWTLGPLALALLAGEVRAEPPAFDTARGYGATARGGRGGRVIQVTSLADQGPGTLRACAAASGPRTCVFRVAGTITVGSPIEVRNPYVTIAGQTAPGGGIQLRNRPGSRETAMPLVVRGSHDVIIRHIRSRPDRAARPSAADAITVEDSRRVILDHVSLTWALDENLGLDGENITVQYSIMAEGRDPHSKGSLACSNDVTWCKRITFYKNLFAHNRDRNPNADTQRSAFDIVNNVVYNPFSEFVEIHNSNGHTLANVVGNTFIPGPWTGGSPPPAIVFHNDTPRNTGTRIYQADNLAQGALLSPAAAALAVGAPPAPLSVRPTGRRAAHDEVLATAGALPRDATDRRIVSSVRNRAGRMTASAELLPSSAAFVADDLPYPDRDGDGMDDGWERIRGLSAADGADRNGDRDGDGYTNLEEFLGERADRLGRGACPSPAVCPM